MLGGAELSEDGGVAGPDGVCGADGAGVLEPGRTPVTGLPVSLPEPAVGALPCAGLLLVGEAVATCVSGDVAPGDRGATAPSGGVVAGGVCAFAGGAFVD